jgi:hypothetical protein
MRFAARLIGLHRSSDLLIRAEINWQEQEMNSKAAYRLPMILSLCWSCGCSTAMNVTDNYFLFGPATNSRIPAPREIYGGTQLAMEIGWNYVTYSNQDGAEFSAVPGLCIWMIDVPLSVVGDTLMLPVTISASIDRSIREYYRVDVPSRLGGEDSRRPDEGNDLELTTD